MPRKLDKRHGSPFWYLRGSVRGVAVDDTERKTADREQAEALRAKREWEIVEPADRRKSCRCDIPRGSRLINGECRRGPLCRSVDPPFKRPRFRRSDKLRSTLVVVAFFRDSPPRP